MNWSSTVIRDAPDNVVLIDLINLVEVAFLMLNQHPPVGPNLI